ncbi:leucyl/phenylalanyl-tRNA--protein transferase [Hyphococcus luteus]|jgi:leucyl/phenylalanyl-tRNA--protein transferase|uniref:Leucyl/phenylalanyl-tRNA--protein transferase n=1 Tax=Hyphococcus luteus TaxID=2058213 RepID=A0A2S7K943_9PROT|nr:leucyl/phenylalanyl-tRNA--protein transferase [Marinicaulis flavus]PQA89027.1 leucyl/phenylalanyl-tRNA--protein transferase [Marinicaulis flavus]
MPRDSATAIPTEDLLKAYTLGYFPMARARDDAHAVWVLPDERGVIPLDQPHVPKRLARFLKTEPFEIRINAAFAQVIAACAEATNARPETWINDAIIEAYTELHFQGRAHSVECWKDGRLAGGLYGVVMGAAFCGESMFSRETDASKIAMLHLMARLKIGGFHFIDAQFYNEHLVQFGLIGVPDADYQIMLAKALQAEADFFAAPDQLSASLVLQSITQTS